MSDESMGEHDTPMPEEGEQTDPMAPPGEDETEVIDLADTPAEVQPEPPPLAEPGMYLCVGEPEGEHAVLGVLEQGQEYDYTHADPRTLQAVAAYVEAGYLEKKDSGMTGDEPRDH
jgi:hypothetical protein